MCLLHCWCNRLHCMQTLGYTYIDTLFDYCHMQRGFLHENKRGGIKDFSLTIIQSSDLFMLCRVLRTQKKKSPPHFRNPSTGLGKGDLHLQLFLMSSSTQLREILGCRYLQLTQQANSTWEDQVKFSYLYSLLEPILPSHKHGTCNTSALHLRDQNIMQPTGTKERKEELVLS